MAGDYSLDLFHLLMHYSGGTAISHFYCNGQPVPRAFAVTAVQGGFSLVNSGFTYHATRSIITRLYIWRSLSNV